MKWASLLKDIKEKVGLSQPQAQPHPSNSFAAVAAAAAATAAASGAGASRAADYESTPYASPSSSPARGKYELELDFKRFWEEFRSSSSEKEKEIALNIAVDAFCRLVKQQYNVGQLVTKLIEAHIFSFVVGRAFVTDVEKLRMYSKGRSLQVAKVINFFSEITKDGINAGSNLLYAVEVLVSGPVDKQPLLDSGILCCLIQILNALLSPDECHQKQFVLDGLVRSVNSSDGDIVLVRRLEVEGSIVHIMKALASHPSAAASLIEDDSLQLLFHMVTNGSSHVFSQLKDGVVHLHTIQLHRHAMQILGLLLANDNGSTAIYIHKHYLVKVLLATVKDFNPERGDPAYTMGIIDLLLECVELSSKPDAGSVRLREDIHNAHGYQYLVQFALTLSSLHENQTTQSTSPEPCLQNSDSHDRHLYIEKHEFYGRDGPSHPQLSPTLSRLLDVLVNLAQAGPAESTSDGKALKSSYGKASTHNRSHTTSGDRFGDEIWEMGNMRIKDLEAIQMLQDIFLKADNVELQEEVLNRMFTIFSSHLDNYKLCQQLRTVPLFILNMAGTGVAFTLLLVAAANYHREVGVLEVLMDDLRQHKLITGVEQQNNAPRAFERTLSSSSFKKHMEDKDAILSSPKIVGSGTCKFRIFEDEQTSAVAWDCLFSLIKKAEASQQSFRSNNGVSVVLPLLASDSHRWGFYGCCHAHPEELGSLVEILKSGMVTRVCNNPINRVRLHTIILSQTFYDLLCESGLLCVDCEKPVIQLLLELALEIITPPSVFYQVERVSTSDTFDDESFFLSSSLLAMDRPEEEWVVFNFSWRQSSHSWWAHLHYYLMLFKIVQVLGAYRLSSSELRILVRHVVQMKVKSSGYLLVDMMEKLIKMEELQSAAVSLAPFVEMDMRKVGYASVQVSLGERTWPPAAGYSFVCWFQFRSFLKSQVKESESSSKIGATRRSISSGIMLRVFSVGAADDGSTFAELNIHDNGILTLSTSYSCSLSFPSTEIEEGSIAYLYLNGKLRHSGKLGYSPSPIGKPLQVTLGTPITRARVTDLSWRLCSCYLFEEVLTASNICFMYILGQGYRGLFQDTDLLRFVPSQACGGGSMAILDSLESELSIASNVQKVDYSAKQGNTRVDGSGIVWDLEKLARLALQLSGKKLIFAFDGTSSDAFGASGTISLLNLVDPTSAASSPIGGIPRYGRLNGDIYICNERAIGDSIRMIGGMSIVLSLVEAAETRDMLHMALGCLHARFINAHRMYRKCNP
ncbi:hypothetical protein HPP92_021305 [Vanilla planifolia]|uniref:Uncharacterized protein n=1 Tax=Vanilla planifolia TaxID=51239 RepID=A0A835PXW3_VANPL|nr:hypothetical protein HPP92_021305 [Vanilla planifolia]